MQHHVQATQWLTNISHNEHKAHNDRRNGQKLTKNSETAKYLVIMNIVWKNEHQPSRSNTNEKGKLRNIQSPGQITPHTGQSEAKEILSDITDRSDCYERA